MFAEKNNYKLQLYRVGFSQIVKHQYQEFIQRRNDGIQQLFSHIFNQTLKDYDVGT